MYAPASLTSNPGISGHKGAVGLVVARIMFLKIKMISGYGLLLVMSMIPIVNFVNLSIFSGSTIRQKMRHITKKIPSFVM